MAKFIDYELTGEVLFFVDENGKKQQVQKGTAEAADLFEEVAKNRDLAGMNGDEAKAAREEAMKPKDTKTDEELAAEKEAADKAEADKAAADALAENHTHLGEVCTREDGSEGVLAFNLTAEGANDATTPLVCVEKPKTEVGAPCTTEDGKKGTMQEVDGAMVCVADAEQGSGE